MSHLTADIIFATYVELIKLGRSGSQPGETLAVRMIANSPTTFLGVEDDWHFVLFATDTSLPVLSLEHLEVSPYVEVSIRDVDTGKSRELKSSIIRFRPLSPAAAHLVVGLVEAITTDQSVGNRLNEFIDLFSLRPLTRNEATGLWGELATIELAENSQFLARSWVDTTHDFAAEDGSRIEVKTTASGNARHHWFSLNQCDPVLHPLGAVASLVTESVTTGVSLQQIAERIQEKLSDDGDLLSRFQRKFTQRIGTTSESAIQEGFDLELARSSLLLFPFSELPRPSFAPHAMSICDANWEAKISELRIVAPNDLFASSLLGTALGSALRP